MRGNENECSRRIVGFEMSIPILFLTREVLVSKRLWDSRQGYSESASPVEMTSN